MVCSENNTGHREELTGSESRDWPPWRRGDAQMESVCRLSSGRASQWFEESEAGGNGPRRGVFSPW